MQDNGAMRAHMDQLIRARYSNLGFGLTIRDDFTRIMLVYYGGASMPVFSSQEDIDAWVANRRQELEDSEADKSVRCYMSMSPTDIKGVSTHNRRRLTCRSVHQPQLAQARAT